MQPQSAKPRDFPSALHRFRCIHHTSSHWLPPSLAWHWRTDAADLGGVVAAAQDADIDELLQAQSQLLQHLDKWAMAHRANQSAAYAPAFAG